MDVLGRFCAFWYDFIVGDDWVIAAGAVLALGLAGVLAHGGQDTLAWVALPLAVALVLWLSVTRAVRAR